jgi:DNA-binding transcriptional LysR family regulator
MRQAAVDNRAVMELRDIEIFLALAEELHFGRAAERLHITAARVSQSIKAQERRIGAPLFERTSRRVRLTPLGKQLQGDLAAAYRQLTEAVQSAAFVAGGITGTLTLGCMGAQPFAIAHVLDLFRTRYPAVDLGIREIQPTAPLNEVRSGEVDVAQVWLPVHEPDLTVGPVVHTDDIVLMVHAGHPFAGRDSVGLEDLGDCAVLRGTAVPRSMEETFHPYVTPSGRPIPRGPVVSSWHEQMSLVATGEAVCAVVADSIRYYSWPNIVYLPIHDAPKCEWAFVWRTANETPLIRTLASTADDAGIA